MLTLLDMENTSETPHPSAASDGRSTARAATVSPPVPQAGSGFPPGNNASTTVRTSIPMLPDLPSINVASLPTVAPGNSASRSGAVAPRAVPQFDAARYPGIAAAAAAMEAAMARWKKMPGPVEWCGSSFEELRLGVCLQMVVNKVHLQKKKGAKGQAWKDFYERTVGIRVG